MDFVSKRLKSLSYPRPLCVGRSNVEIGKAVPVRTLFELALNEEQLPPMKSYSFMPREQIDLDVRVPDVHNHAQLVDLYKRNDSYLQDKKKFEDEEEAKRLDQEKEDEKARIIAEYEANKQTKETIDVQPGEAQ